MKQLLLITIILFLHISIAMAQAKYKRESTYLKVRSGEDITTYEFHSVQDFEENSMKILDEIPAANLPGKKEKDQDLTIEISITITSTDTSITITGSVTAPSQTIIAAVKKLQKQLVGIAME
ncbi:hypothetical protein HKT18_03030 [Flavobacterium sp. IMCC34852]|uniref:Uncharacterized protein n=1 Tax=Flavobacterium rivulicola TaxID=2732161 RepID=A0A7Y3R7X2_9FLAO|nr:hypothetical protein [Flavobacterium sp. IMCC34852]NNT71181.1 hypothetical protein [Flavobacterium sp. IMCC34852]